MNTADEIPRDFHFIFGLRPQVAPFHIAHYLCLQSCINVNRPNHVYFHYHEEPHGPWWEKIRHSLELRKVTPEAFISATDLYDQHREGRLIRKHGLEYAHHSDFLRLRILQEYGGVYADIDTLFVRPYPESYYEPEFLLGRESPVRTADGGVASSLCNAVILSKKRAEFGRIWLNAMYETFDGSWNAHSCLLAAKLMRTHRAEIEVISREHFYFFDCTRQDLQALFLADHEVPEDLYSIHLWSHLWWDRERTDFMAFSNEDITAEYILGGHSTYARLAQPFLDVSA